MLGRSATTSWQKIWPNLNLTTYQINVAIPVYLIIFLLCQACKWHQKYDNNLLSRLSLMINTISRIDQKSSTIKLIGQKPFIFWSLNISSFQIFKSSLRGFQLLGQHKAWLSLNFIVIPSLLNIFHETLLEHLLLPLFSPPQSKEDQGMIRNRCRKKLYIIWKLIFPSNRS